MTDIVDILRALRERHSYLVWIEWLVEAADEIERLQARIAELEGDKDRATDLNRMLKRNNGALLSQKTAVEHVAKGYGWDEGSDHDQDALGFIIDRIAELEAQLLKERNDKADAIHNAAMANIELEMQPEQNGWYCAQCERGVDPSEVTFNEAHTECGRIITNDRPPALTATGGRDAEIGRLVRLKMASGNSVPVERCIITAAEIAAIAQQETNHDNQ